MKKLLLTSILSAFGLLLVPSAYAVPSPINGQCGSIDGMTISSFPVAANQYAALCANGEVINFTNAGTATLRTLTWTCEGLYGGTSQACTANGNASLFNDMVSNGTGCGIANTQSFISNAPDLISLANSNNNSAFLGNLCQGDTAPITFSENSLGWTRDCPGVWNGGTLQFDNPVTCNAFYYFDSECGDAAGTGHAIQPITDLCQPGNIASMMRYNVNNNNWEWECEGGGNGSIASCSARSTDTSTISPACDASVIVNNEVDGFPGQELCGIGYLKEWEIDNVTERATWKCEFNNQTTPTCGNVVVDGFDTNAGTQCNGASHGQTFRYQTDLDAVGYCSNGGIPDSFDNLATSWQWTCGPQTCQAFKDTEATMCGYATNTPHLTPPTQGLCEQGQVVSQVVKYQNTWKWVCSDIQNGGFCSNAGCQLNYPNQAAICEAPRIVIGSCERMTQLNVDGFHTPDELIQSGLCRDGYPEPLIPIQDFGLNKWSWTCEGTPNLGTDELCLANAGIPDLEIVYDIPRPLPFPVSLSENQLVDGPVISYLTGYDPLYLTFTSPFGQDHRLFTQTGYFLFEYQDWAGNTGSTMVFVDWIRAAGTQAYPVYSTTSPTSGYVDVHLEGYDSAQNPTTFAGPCIAQGYCSIMVGAHPYDLTIRFTDNSEGTFTVTDHQGNVQTILVNVTNIDTVIPTATLYYSHTSTTSEDVVVEVISRSEPITMINNGGHFSYTFTQTGEFTFQFVDAAGNANSLLAEVTWIDKDAPSAEIHYSTTGETSNNVFATLTNFTESGIIVHNNDGNNTFEFDHNGEFTFVLVDATGNTGTVRAYVDWINKPILTNLIEQYQDNICLKIPKVIPQDIFANENHLEILTVIRNCLMKGYRGHNNHYYFYPNNYITRGEFLRVTGRFIRMNTDYSSTLLNFVSDEFINVMAEGDFAKDISEADAWGLLFYTPLLQENIHKKISWKDPIPQKEAKMILKKTLELVGMDPRIMDTLINEGGKLTRGEAAYIFGNLMLSFEDIAIGNNLELMKALEWRLQSIPHYKDQRVFITKLLLRILKIPEATLRRVGLHPVYLKQDMIAIIKSQMPQRRKKEYLNLKTIVDNYLLEFPDPHLNHTVNDTEAYTYKMFNDF